MAYRIIKIDANTVRLSYDGTTPIDLRTLNLRPSGVRLQSIGSAFAPGNVSTGAGTITVPGNKLVSGAEFRVSTSGVLPGGLTANTTYKAIVVGGAIKPSLDGVTPIQITSQGSGNLQIDYVSAGEVLKPPYKVVRDIEVQFGAMVAVQHLSYSLNDGEVRSVQVQGGLMPRNVLGPVTDIGAPLFVAVQGGLMARVLDFEPLTWSSTLPDWPDVTTLQWQNMR
jgi:hypothetical protein